ncbi:minichromosome maintenance family protein [Perilla frutescens var. hirtella]|uniref:DNA replication licensing factor MCM2 n=1 Tax=Perilla frutescens var. hirtella TaxID=608512 RepID=A0AAD4PG06_PERFH|nr:minichromosome maintenance family protein [Perilla frutescens var. hirtella]
MAGVSTNGCSDDEASDSMEVVRVKASQEARVSPFKLPHLLHDQDRDDESYVPSKRSRAYSKTQATPIASLDDEPAYRIRGTGTIREWVATNLVRRFICRRFEEFLLTYVDPKSEKEDSAYLKQINEMVSVNKCSLEIDHRQFRDTVALYLVNAPRTVLEVMEDVANKLIFDLFPDYKKIHEKIYVRITNLSAYKQIRNLGQSNLNYIIRIGGVVTRCTGVLPQLQQVKYDCNTCGAILGPFVKTSYAGVKVGSCSHCQSKGPFTVNIEQTIYRNYQKLTLQESSGIIPAGLPRCTKVILLNDLVDCARPGEEIEVTGIYTKLLAMSLSTKKGFPVSVTLVEANYVAKKQDPFLAYKLTQGDKKKIKLAKDPRI